MWSLRTVGLVVGIAGLGCGLCGLLLPALSRKAMKGFPRNRTAAFLLTAIVIGWAFWLLYHATFIAAMPVLQKVVLVVGPISYVLIVSFLDELLAARSFGGLLLLLPRPLLAVAFPHDQTQWRLVLTTLAYLWVIAGIVLLLSPYYFRRACELLAGTDRRCRAVGVVFAGVGCAVIVLSLTVY